MGRDVTHMISSTRRYTKSECSETFKNRRFKTSEWFLILDRRTHVIAETVLTKDSASLSIV